MRSQSLWTRHRFNASLVASGLFAADIRPVLAADTITVGAAPVEPSAEAYYADAGGYFKAAGLNVEISVLPNSAAMIAALSSSSLQFGNVNVLAFAQATGNGIPLVIVAPSTTWDDASNQLVVTKNSPFTTARDLNGKTVGVAVIKNIPTILTQYWMDRTGGDSRTVKFIELGNAQMVPSLQAGRIDAAFLTEPFLTLSKGDIRPITTTLMGGLPRPLGVGVWVASSDWAKVNPTIISSFAGAIIKTAYFANANHEKTAIILAQLAKMDPRLIAHMARIQYATRLNASQLQPLLDLATKYAGLPPAQISRWIYQT